MSVSIHAVISDGEYEDKGNTEPKDEAIELLKLAQGHMFELWTDLWKARADVERHNALTKRVGEFVRAHSTGPQAAKGPSL